MCKVVLVIKNNALAVALVRSWWFMDERAGNTRYKMPLAVWLHDTMAGNDICKKKNGKTVQNDD
jgi:hypothetical protein